MNSTSNFIESLQDLIVQVPDLVQFLIVGAVAMVPFLEGELAATLGVWAGFNPVAAFAVAAAGNFLSVFAVVTFGSRAREAIIARRARAKAPVASGGAVLVQEQPDSVAGEPAKPESKGRQRFRRFLVRFGVPGASLLGPLALPTQFTSAMLVASGVSRRWVLLWQGIAIVIWTGLTTLVATGVLALIATA
ncbi:small multidrug efflux protein [Microbacterium sp. CPCC 204701]|uniref:small multidrug efflux protein n=1 Tax=Microbacterium sp. CPCC 204701 TaxID=2493084 RepID=UPI000FD8052E|nr:small multidrug efflux protein [Microbacterium sp. CPCC 204701]